MTRPRIDDALLADVVGWDVGTWSSAVRHWESVLAPRGGPLDCLEVGAGPGGPSLWLALAGHRVTCSNLDHTETQARPLHERYGIADRVTYRDLDVQALPFHEEFDVAVFKSVLGGIPDGGQAEQRLAIENLHAALRPGGLLLFAENLRGTPVHRLARSAAYRRRGVPQWRYLSLSELREHLRDFELVQLHTTGVLALFGPTETSRRALSRVDRVLGNRLMPARGHYVVYGSALKPAAP